VGTAEWLPRHYAGHPQDEDSGLVYMQARWMDPESGTVLSVDPVVPDAGDPQALNAYAYVRNNPTEFSDPTGKFLDECSLGGCRRYGFVSSIQGYEAGSAEVGDPGCLESYGWQPGSGAANLGAFDGSSRETGAVAAISIEGNQNGGMSGKVGDVLGKIWNLPNTLIGMAYGIAGMAVGALATVAWGALHVASLGRLGGFVWLGGSADFGHNAIQFHNNPLQISAVTVGNAIIYSPRSGFSASQIGAQEGQHTIQGQWLGPLYIPSHILLGMAALLVNGDWHGDINILESGPHSSNPRPF